MDDKDDIAEKKTAELREKYREFIEDVISNLDKSHPNIDKLKKLRKVLFGEKR